MVISLLEQVGTDNQPPAAPLLSAGCSLRGKKCVCAFSSFSKERMSAACARLELCRGFQMPYPTELASALPWVAEGGSLFQVRMPWDVVGGWGGHCQELSSPLTPAPGVTHLQLGSEVPELWHRQGARAALSRAGPAADSRSIAAEAALGGK